MKDKIMMLLVLYGLCCLSLQALANEEVVLLNTYSSEQLLFVQGFEQYNDKQLIIGTGRYGESAIGLLTLKTGEFESLDNLDTHYFGEGLTRVDEVIWQFTWREGTAFKRDAKTFEVLETYTYQGEGWGMAYDAKADIIWTSDGTNRLTKRNSRTFEALEQISVTQNNQPIEQLNELEFANEAIYANIWQTNDIIKIDIETGKVLKRWDLSFLVDQLTFENQDANQVLNGIAHIEDDRFYITGKLYPVIWEVNLVE